MIKFCSLSSGSKGNTAFIEINGDNLINHDSARDIIFNHLQEIKENDFENIDNRIKRE